MFHSSSLFVQYHSKLLLYRSKLKNSLLFLYKKRNDGHRNQGSLEGYGQAFVTSPQQKLEWNDMLFLKTLPSSIRNQNLWPQKPQKFRETLETYSEDMRKVAISLATFIAMALEIETHEEISRACQEGTYEVRMNLYPPCPESDDMPRLQALKDGQWVTVLPKHGAIVVNLGHITEVSPDHRAVVNRLKERQSIVIFCYPNTSFNIGPAKELTISGDPPLYKTLAFAEYVHNFFNRRLDVSFIDVLKI
ncbi:hypothetical protein Patl1_17284 [Pistacia atlantica]|uniref:Uncharacterized protein n=1 Tax=Pistacia atlantica TaxID=434234 RepID=A0ACC1B7P0_9ROSI|nr:hypothetical protein Patl1_17284 [Pistacia atlantica]